MKKKFHYQYYENKKWRSVMLILENGNNQVNKPEFDSRYPLYECNNRIDELLSLLPFLLVYV